MTVSGMDAADKPPWTDSRRVTHARRRRLPPVSKRTREACRLRRDALPARMGVAATLRTAVLPLVGPRTIHGPLSATPIPAGSATASVKTVASSAASYGIAAHKSSAVPPKSTSQAMTDGTAPGELQANRPCAMLRSITL
ncbi:hypothetical protein GCM10027159_14360 [Lysobacter terrae]